MGFIILYPSETTTVLSFLSALTKIVSFSAINKNDASCNVLPLMCVNSFL